MTFGFLLLAVHFCSLFQSSILAGDEIEPAAERQSQSQLKNTNDVASSSSSHTANIDQEIGELSAENFVFFSGKIEPPDEYGLSVHLFTDKHEKSLLSAEDNAPNKVNKHFLCIEKKLFLGRTTFINLLEFELAIHCHCHSMMFSYLRTRIVFFFSYVQ